MSRLMAAIGCLLGLRLPGTAQEPGAALLSTFPRGEEACYGRVYDAAHLARHPRQAMSAFHHFKSLTPDPQKEEGYRGRDVEAALDRRETSSRWLSVLVRFKDQPGRLYRQEVECAGGPDGFACGRDCDGGGFTARRSGEKLVLSQDPAFSGLRLESACDADPEGATRRLDPKEDATTWVLHRLPMSACHAERDAARPPYARGADPVTTRFVDKGKVCHARTYDAAHLARHPGQRIAAMALRTEDRVRWTGEIDDFETVVPVTLTARLRDGTSVTRTARCTAQDYHLGCHGEGGAFMVVRDGEKALRVRDFLLKSADREDRDLPRFLGLDLGDDDRVFRLDLADQAACD